MANAKTAEGTLFAIHLTGSISGKTWSGDFRAKPLLSFQDQISVDRYRRELLGVGAENAAPEVFATAACLSELAYRLTETPEWWRESKGGLGLVDPNVVEEVYKSAKQIESELIEKIEKEGKDAQAALRSKK